MSNRGTSPRSAASPYSATRTARSSRSSRGSQRRSALGQLGIIRFDPAGTEAKFRELLPEAERSGDESLHAQLLSQIARTRILLERGRTHNSSGRRRTAVRIFEEALALAERGGHDFHAVDAAHMLDIAEMGELSLEWNMKTIAMAESAREDRARGWLGSLYNNTGWTYHDMGEYVTALDLFKRALAFRESKGQVGSIRIAKLITRGEAAASPYFGRAWRILSADAWLQANDKARLTRLQQLGDR